MSEIDIDKTAKLIIEDMRSRKVSEQQIAFYSSSGFNAYFHHFSHNGKNIVNPKDIDSFICEQRLACDDGKLSVRKWSTIRRCGELLKSYPNTMTSELAPLSPWNFGINKPLQSLWRDNPSDEQLEDPDNIFHLVWKTKKWLDKSGLKFSSIRHYTSEGLHVIMRLHYDNKTETYSRELIENALKKKRHQVEQGEARERAFQYLRKAAYFLNEMHQLGSIHMKQLVDWNYKQLSSEYSAIVDAFYEWGKKYSGLAESTIKGIISAARQFLFFMEDIGVYSVEEFDGRTVNMAVSKIASKYDGGLKNAMHYICKFLRFLFDKGYTSQNLACNMPESVPHKTKHIEGFAQDEVDLLLEQPNRETCKGKRDYAIVTLALQTGLRACDIVNLKRSDIDWNKREINIIQQKTGRLITVVLQPESGNAIADYLLSFRNDSYPYIFTCTTGVMRPLNRFSASKLVARLMRKAGISLEKERRGFHSFRRTFATSLLHAGVSTQLIMQMLGQWHPDSMIPYLSIDEQGLKWCSIDLSSVQEEKEDDA